MAVLAEAGRYPMRVFAAQMLLRYWNRLVRMEDDRLVKRAFMVSAALAGSTQCRSRHKPWAGQAAAVWSRWAFRATWQRQQSSILEREFPLSNLLTCRQ